ncbi:MAG: hypothetical protein AABY22_33280 [Nanoarchaeota archaeon]
MKITFKLLNDQKILIMNGYKEIGHIFTPASSGNDITNAIQVCGFEEAYDYWGCGIYGEEKIVKIPLTPEDISHLFEFSKSENKWQQEMAENCLKKGYHEDKRKLIMKKDIQLLFSDYDSIIQKGSHSTCAGCFNHPCTCDNKNDHNHLGAYNPKREFDLKDKLEFKTEQHKTLFEEQKNV